jgi:hypothetical protein
VVCWRAGLGAFALGDVAQEDLDGSFALFHHRRPHHLDVHSRAVQADDLLLQYRRPLAGEQLADALTNDRMEVGVEELEGRFAQKLLRAGRAEQLKGGRVHQHNSIVAVDEHRLGGQFHQAAIPFLALPQLCFRPRFGGAQPERCDSISQVAGQVRQQSHLVFAEAIGLSGMNGERAEGPALGEQRKDQ